MKRIRIPLQIIGRCQLAVCLENENENCTNDEAKNIDEFAIFAPPNEIRSWSTIQYTAALFHGISFLQAFCSLLIVCARARARRCTQISLWPFNLFESGQAHYLRVQLWTGFSLPIISMISI